MSGSVGIPRTGTAAYRGGTVNAHTTPFSVRGEAPPYRPRLSRETRRLLATAVLAMLMLWILARLRFPGQPLTPNPVPTLLTQLARAPRFADLASTVGALRAQVTPFITSIAPAIGDEHEVGPATTDRVPALRIGSGLAITILDPHLVAPGRDRLGLMALDSASGLALVRVEEAEPSAIPIVWQPQRLDEPRYLMVASSAPDDLWLRPVFIGQLNAVRTPRWEAPVWAVPAKEGLTPGGVVFTESAELVGMVALHGDGVVIVPARELLRAAETLRTQPPAATPDIGVEVQPLTPELSAVGGTETGVVVAWVDPLRMTPPGLLPGDVVVAVNGEPVRTVAEWEVRLARLTADKALTLRVMYGGAERDVEVNQQPAPRAGTTLGLIMRSVARVGAEVVRVDRASAAATAGLLPGDLVTAIGVVDAPTPARIRSAFAATAKGEILIVAVTRRDSHLVVGLRR